MRLTCPNCDAQYEVPDEVMPISGRDVQCSNCGQTWFQHHPDHAPEEDEMIEAADAPDPDEEVAPPPPPPPSKEPKQRELDPAVADILRQEAEAEFEARKRRQSETLESQPELGLEASEERAPVPQETEQDDHDAERRAADARKRMARMRGEPISSAEAAAAAGISSRRELLPDIEEINSTLRSNDAPSGMDAEARKELGAGGEQKQKRGFRTGFRTVVLIAILLALLYIFAPRISAAVPALDGVMSAYVGVIDQARAALDGPLRNLLGWINDTASESGS